jgi:hypothetical protein
MMAALFGGELVDTMDAPGIWFPVGIGVPRAQYVYAIAIRRSSVHHGRNREFSS